MTKSRCHKPGQTSHVTRRCRGRKYYLKPTPFIRQAMEYQVARAAQKTRVEVAGVMTMSNHFHIQLLDPRANRSDFMQYLVRALTFRLQSLYDLVGQGSMWQAGQYMDVHKWGLNTELGTLLYIWLNPVAAGLVERVRDWPGFMILPEDWGKTRTVKKPAVHYGRRGPDEITYTPRRPGCCRHLDDEELVGLMNRLIGQLEEHYAAIRRREGKEVIGVEGVMALDPHDSPDTPTKRAAPSPRTGFSADTMEQVKIMEDQHRSFLDNYERQRQKWVSGQDVAFPAGTLKMRRQTPVICRDVRPDEPGIYQPISSGCRVKERQDPSSDDGGAPPDACDREQSGDSKTLAALPKALRGALHFDGDAWEVIFSVVDVSSGSESSKTPPGGSGALRDRRLEIERETSPQVSASGG